MYMLQNNKLKLVSEEMGANSKEEKSSENAELGPKLIRFEDHS